MSNASINGPAARGPRAGALVLALVTGTVAAACVAEPAPGSDAAARQDAVRDGRHDFDFAAGTWHTHIRRTLDPFDPASAAVELDGTVTSRPVWGGRAWLEEIEADGPNGHWQAQTLFLYNPVTHQWSMNFLNSAAGTPATPLVGAFARDGRGELLSGDTFKGRAILVRGVWTALDADAHEYTESYSDDGGRTWRVAFVGHKTRIAARDVTPVPVTHTDFDFELGKFTTRSTRLANPLDGGSRWITAEGTTVVRPVWGGKANLAEVHLEMPSGPVDFLALRWFNPDARQWFLAFANAATGTLGVPMAGVFRDGRIEFYDAEPVDGRQVLVRFALWPTGAGGGASEQAFSTDGGRTWSVNYRTRYVRTGGA